MKKIAMIVFAVVFAATAFATEPPAFGGYDAGWGQNPNNWDHQEGSYNSGLCLFDPDEGDYVQFDELGNRLGVIVYDPITIELWVELHMIGTYEATSYQFHRVNEDAYDGETIEFVINSTVRSNQTNWCGLTPGPDGFDALIFRHGMYGGGADIPLTWYGRWGSGLTPDDGIAWQEITPDNNGLGFVIPKCDHWLQFKGEFFLPYHVDDGYYSLEIAGCPAPQM